MHKAGEIAVWNETIKSLVDSQTILSFRNTLSA